MAPHKKQSFGSIRQLPSGRWQARYTAPNGQRVKAPATFATQLQASTWLGREKRLIDLDAWEPIEVREARDEAAALTTGEWIEQFHDSLRPHKRPGTLLNYDRRVQNRILKVSGPAAALRDIPLTQLTKADIQAWWDAVSIQFADHPTSNYQAYGRLKAALAEAVHRDMIPANPAAVRAAARRPRPKKKYLPRRDELIAVIEAAPGRYQLLLGLVFLQGLRIGEAVGLEQKHLKLTGAGDDLHGVVQIRQSANRIEPDDGPVFMQVGPPKTEAGYRDNELSPTVLKYAETHVKKYLPTKPTTISTTKGEKQLMLLTATSKGTMPSPTSLRTSLPGWIEKAGASPELHFHAGRYYVNAVLAENGYSPRVIGDILGESDLATITEVYMQATEGHRKGAAKALG